MNIEAIKPIIEALLLVSQTPLTLERICQVVAEADRSAVRGAIEALQEEYRAPGRGLLIAEVAGGYQLRTRPETAEWIRRLARPKTSRMSRAALETLAIVAYKQPITRPELEELRGVDSGAVLATLLERRLIRIIGKKDAPGRPLVYATSREFLETFGLRDLSGLPSLAEIAALSEGLRPPAADEAAEAGGEGALGGEGAAESEGAIEAGAGPAVADGPPAVDSASVPGPTLGDKGNPSGGVPPDDEAVR